MSTSALSSPRLSAPGALDALAIVGTTLRHTSLDGLACLARPLGEAPRLATLLRALDAKEGVLLTTCNRVELVYIAERQQTAADARIARDILAGDSAAGPDLRILTCHEALRHIFRVVSSLDSPVVGEDQVLNQVRTCLATAQSAGCTGPRLRRVFDFAFRTAKRLRAEIVLDGLPRSLAERGVGELLRHTDFRSRRTVLVGTGSTAALAARSLRSHGFDLRFVVSTSASRAKTLAAELGTGALSLADLQASPPEVDVVVCASRSTGFILDAALFARLRGRFDRRVVCLDLGLPPNAQSCGQVHRIDLETLLRNAPGPDLALEHRVGHYVSDFERRERERALIAPLARRLGRLRDRLASRLERELGAERARSAAGHALHVRIAKIKASAEPSMPRAGRAP